MLLSGLFVIRKNFLTYLSKSDMILMEGSDAPEVAYRRRIKIYGLSGYANRWRDKIAVRQNTPIARRDKYAV